MSAGTSRLLAWLALATALLSALLGAGSPSPALAAKYKVEICTSSAPGGSGIFSGDVDQPGPFFFDPCGVAVPGGIRQGLPAESGLVVESGKFWVLVGPENTRIATLELEQSFAHSSPSFLDWALISGDGTRLFRLRDDGRNGGMLPPATTVTYSIGARSVSGILQCFPIPSCSGGEFVVTLKNLVATFEDNAPPTVFAPGVSGGAVRGTTEVPFNASDPGAGVASAALVVDGQEQRSVPDVNGGRCQQPYQDVLPCRPTLSSSLPLDTLALNEGPHQVQVVVEDAAGLRAVSAPVTVTVHNAPTNTARPSVTGSARIRGTLTATTGTWAGAPIAFTYQWLRCEAAVTTAGDLGGCLPIPGATAQQYAPTKDDANHRDLVRVTALNAKGSGSEVSAPSEVIADATAPALTHVSLSRKRLRLARAATSAGATTFLRFSSTEAGRLTILIDRTPKGQRPKHVATLTAKIKAGRTTVPLSTTIGGKPLTPGRYQVTITVRDAERNDSGPVKRPFTVVRG
jgi:hypothetical protein